MAEDPFDRLLRRSLRREAGSAGCPDPSLLAALSDDTLSAGERRALRTHAASCERCTAVLALMAASDEPTASRPRGVLPGPGAWRWAVPLVTAALVFVVWTETDRRARLDEIAGEAATSRFEARQPAPDGPAPDAIPHAPAIPEPQLQAAPSSPTAAEPPAAAKARGARPLDDRLQARRDKEAPAPAEPEAQPRLETVPPTSDMVLAEGRAAGGRVAGRQDAAEQDATAAPPPAEAGTDLAETLRLTRDREPPGGSAARSQTSPLELQAPDGVRVRAGQGGIERREASGPWRLERAAPAERLHAGACPTALVCWLAGDNGLVLRREATGAWIEARVTGGGTVTAIDAVDGLRAIVTLADGSRLSTADGGRAWSPLP